MKNLKSHSTIELLQLHGKILDELLERKIIRTRNNPTSDYAEQLVSDVLNLKLENNSQSGHDAISKKKERIQIKCRRLTNANGSRQLGVIRNLDKKPFDVLVAVLFDEDYGVREAYWIPLGCIKRYAKYRQHQNGHILYASGPLLKDPRVKDIASKFKRK